MPASAMFCLGVPSYGCPARTALTPKINAEVVEIRWGHIATPSEKSMGGDSNWPVRDLDGQGVPAVTAYAVVVVVVQETTRRCFQVHAVGHRSLAHRRGQQAEP